MSRVGAAVDLHSTQAIDVFEYRRNSILTMHCSHRFSRGADVEADRRHEQRMQTHASKYGNCIGTVKEPLGDTNDRHLSAQRRVEMGTEPKAPGSQPDVAIDQNHLRSLRQRRDEWEQVWQLATVKRPRLVSRGRTCGAKDRFGSRHGVRPSMNPDARAHYVVDSVVHIDANNHRGWHLTRSASDGIDDATRARSDDCSSGARPR